MRSRKQCTLLETGSVVLVAFILDLLGEPPTNLHPVVWYGKLIRYMEYKMPPGRLPQLLYGVVMLALAMPVAVLPALLIECLVGYRRRRSTQQALCGSGELWTVIVEGAALKPFFALRMLVEAGRAVRLALEREDLPAARRELQSLVSRDRSQLTEELAAAAAIESLAENLSDSVVAPFFYYAFFGLPGAALYRLCNTFDSMIGYHGQYEYIGKAAARVDDLLNLIPARLTALLIIGMAPLFDGKRRDAWRIWRRDARKTASPNAGHPMAAAAGALGVQLEKVDHYKLGERKRTIITTDIQRAEWMVWRIGGLVMILAVLARVFLPPCADLLISRLIATRKQLRN